MSDPIRLYAKQTAAPKTCGACVFFRREPNDDRYLAYAPTRGQCDFKFPPWMKLLHTHARRSDSPRSSDSPSAHEVVDNSSDWTRVEDADRCDLWRPSAASYVKDQTWSAADEASLAPMPTHRDDLSG